MQLYFFLIAVCVITLLIVVVDNHRIELKRKNHARIKAFIESRGCLFVWASRGVADGRQGVISYQVVFRDSDGVEHNARCMVEPQKSGTEMIYWGGGPFWSGPPSPLETLRSENAELRSRLASRSATKEQIISDLARRNEQLEAKLKALQDLDPVNG
ncbi:MAG: hypothetical protein AAF614_22600 [Chloroflexota bacterium]